MSDFTVTIDVDTDNPITEDDLLALDGNEYGAAASGRVGGHRLSCTLNIGGSLLDAAREAAHWVTKHVPGTPVAVEAMTNAEFDRRLEEPAFPQLAGIAEVADLLRVSRQRASELQTRSGFPAPVAQLRSGPVWRIGDLSRFDAEWDRKPGRPPKVEPGLVVATD